MIREDKDKGCRAGKAPLDERLARLDQQRHELRKREMKGVGNWSTGGRRS